MFTRVKSGFRLYVGTQEVYSPRVLRLDSARDKELLVRSEKFDEFKKGEKTSLAFRLVFQSTDRTLTDNEVNGLMVKAENALKKAGFEVR